MNEIEKALDPRVISMVDTLSDDRKENDELLSLLAYEAPDITRGQRERSMSDIKTLGAKILRRWNIAFHDLLCGGKPEDKDDRDKLIAAIGLGDRKTIASMIATIAITSFAMSAAPAAIMGVLLSRIIVEPAVDEVCKAWGQAITTAA